jgi:nucleotide-binding universal stress UspA family protein
MKNVLLVTVLGIETPNAIAYAVQRARDSGGELIALAVLDPDLGQRVATTLANVGFLGEKVSDNVVDTVAREQHTHAEELLRKVREQASNQGVECRILIEEGDPGEVCGRVIDAHDVAVAVLVAEKRSWLTRFLSRSAAVNLPALAGCEVRVMDD